MKSPLSSKVSMSNKVILGFPLVMASCEDKTNPREVCGTSQKSCNQNHGFLSCAQILSGGVKNFSDQVVRPDCVEGLLQNIAGRRHCYDRLAIYAIGGNILITVICCVSLLYMYRHLGMHRSKKTEIKVMQAGSSRVNWQDIYRNYTQVEKGLPPEVFRA